MGQRKRSDASSPGALQLPIRLFDRVRAAFALPDMPVIVADDIQRQIDLQPDRGPAWNPPVEDYGLCPPPFGRFFVEAAVRREAGWLEIAPGRREYLPAALTHRGVAVYEVTEANRARVIPPDMFAARPAETRWTLAMYGYHWISYTGLLQTFPGPMYAHIAADGRVLDESGTGSFRALSYPSGIVVGPPDITEPLHVDARLLPSEMLANFAPFALKAIGAMHRRCAVDRVEPTRQDRRRAARKERLQLHSYYVLRVKPTAPGESFRAVGAPQKVEPRAHLVRGHFRYYTEERPLFGRVVGAVFVPEHERGAGTYGTIRKDYEPTE